MKRKEGTRFLPIRFFNPCFGHLYKWFVNSQSKSHRGNGDGVTMRNVVEISLGKLKRGRNKWKQRQKRGKGIANCKKGMHRALEHGASQSNSSFRWIKFEKNYRFLGEISPLLSEAGRLYHLLRGILVIPKRCATESP
ncbi:MAG: hypothetical protein ACLR23_00760 [Clostridia bacterium]